MFGLTIQEGSTDDRNRGRQGGFTYQELLVVMAIIGLIVAIGIPNLHRARIRADLMEEVKTVRQALAVARMSAIKNSRRVVVSLIPGDTAQPGFSVTAWVDEAEDETLSPGDEIVGAWNLGIKALIGPDSTAPEWSLHLLPGSLRGIIFFPSGSAVVHGSSTEIGIGFGSVVISDLKDNRIRLLIAAGAGTVDEQMWDPDIGVWSDELKYWRY